MQSINIAEAKSRFSELVSRVSGGERFLIQRRDHPLAVLISQTELEQLERTAQLAHRLALALGQDDELLAQVEAGEIHSAMLAFSLWRDEADFETLADEIYANRKQQVVRADIGL